VATVEVDLDPLDLVRAGAGAFGAAAYFSAPRGRVLSGLGTAWAAEASGPERFGAVDTALRTNLPEGIPVFCGFAFSPASPIAPEWQGFPAAVVLLPQIAAGRDGRGSRLTVAVPPGASPGAVLAAAATLRRPAEPVAPAAAGVRAVPPVGEWRQRVRAAAAAAGVGGPAKVVLARSLRVALDHPAEPFDLVALLGARFPEAYAYGWQAGGAALVGASPELLVSREGDRLACFPLAGSAARGEDAAADRRRGEALLASPKNRAEHALVVEAIDAALRPRSLTLEVPSQPVLHRLAGVQHLATPITGTTSARLLDLVAALHPTPAVGGVPTEAALGVISAVEGFDRGWYGGGIGWTNAAGQGEVAVALRGALVRSDEARLYAGAGILAGSDPDEEVEETDLKLGAALGVFGGSS